MVIQWSRGCENEAIPARETREFLLTKVAMAIQSERPNMRYRSHRPVSPLGDLVSFWTLTDAPAHGRERIGPSGTLELVINLDQDQFRIYDGLRPARPE